MTICKCGWKHDAQKCPMCGDKASTRTKPSRRPIRRHTDKRAATQKRMKEEMRNVARRSPQICSHCGLAIAYWKFSNLHHVEAKSQNRERIDDPDNLSVLCDDVDLWYKRKVVTVGELSCHSIQHFGTESQWEAKKDKYR